MNQLIITKTLSKMKTEFTNKIEAIKIANNGDKLIAFSKVLNFKGCKPQVTPCRFADYNGNVLRVYWGAGFNEYIKPSWKSALMFLRTAQFQF